MDLLRRGRAFLSWKPAGPADYGRIGHVPPPEAEANHYRQVTE